MEKTYRLLWTKNAEEDLLNIIEHIKEESPKNAKSVFAKIKKHAASSNFFPLKGRVVPELQHEGITFYREVVVSPWRIIYKIGDDTVYIMAIIDSRQNVEDILLQKLLR
jgi:plasmid stabilization system protein ParE